MHAPLLLLFELLCFVFSCVMWRGVAGWVLVSLWPEKRRFKRTGTQVRSSREGVASLLARLRDTRCLLLCNLKSFSAAAAGQWVALRRA